MDVDGLLGSAVALRKESVDRNMFKGFEWVCLDPSLSARRAWIEIAQDLQVHRAALVALRKESVDRNTNNSHILVPCFSRSPQGERG